MIVDESNNLNVRIDQAVAAGDADAAFYLTALLNTNAGGAPKPNLNHVPHVGSLSITGRAVTRTSP